jgi:hypothetical protein
MATSLEAKIEFRRLCDVLENVTKAHGVREKMRILRTFIDDCRRMADKLKTEYPESVRVVREDRVSARPRRYR